MEIKKKGKEITIKHTLKRGEIYRIGEGSKFKTITISKKPTKVTGITSYCDDGKHIIYVDWDFCAKWLVIEDIYRIQKNHNLTPFYLFTTKEKKDKSGETIGNYHGICLMKHNSKDIYEILSETNCDYAYINMIKRNPFKSWVLRISPKRKRNRPKFVGVVGKKINLDKKISSAHLQLLKKLYPKLPYIPYSNGDNLSKIKLNFYETLN